MNHASPGICLRAERLTFKYPGAPHPAVDQLSLEITRGQRVAILGANGSGKSTLAKLFTGLLTPFTGSLEVLGIELSDSKQVETIRGRVGLVFQSPDTQMVAPTVEREIAFGAENLGLPRPEIRQRVDYWLERFQLQRYARRSPQQLSGGEKQRVALASVLVMQPELVILDEVTSLLDPHDRVEVRQIIQDLNPEQTVVMITQFAEEALFMERVILLQAGQVARDASPEDVFSGCEEEALYGVEVPLIIRLQNRVRSAD